MLMSFSLLFLFLEQFILISVPSGEAVVYYVKPTAPPNSICPGLPCQMLDYYFHNKDEYLSSDKVNVTMLFLHGWHTLTGSSDSYSFTNVQNLEKFEMIGMEPAYAVVLYLATNITFENVIITYLGSLTFKSSQVDQGKIFLWQFTQQSKNTKQSPVPYNYADNIMSLNGKKSFAIVNGTIFNCVSLLYIYQNNTYVIHVMNSIFQNKSLLSVSGSSSVDTNFVPHIEVSNCTFSNSPLSFVCAYANMEIYDIVYENKCTYAKLSEPFFYHGLDITTLYCNVTFGRNVLFNFHHASECGDSIVFQSSNVTISGNVVIVNNTQTSIVGFSSIITLTIGNISFVNNTGTNGGAMALYSSTLNIAANTSVYFINNTATQTGGAIFVSNDNIKSIHRFPLLYITSGIKAPYFYQLLGYNREFGYYYNIQFINNSATNGGDHIYGEAMHSDICYVTVASGFYIKSYEAQNQSFVYLPERSISSVSSDPTRVCTCHNNQPQCQYSRASIAVHPGETFTLPVVIVGADLGTTVGAVYAVFSGNKVALQLNNEYEQGIRVNKICVNLNYTILSGNGYEVLYLTPHKETFTNLKLSMYLNTCPDNDTKCISERLIFKQLHLNVTLLPCPLGFTLLGDPPGCDCYPLLRELGIHCNFIKGKGYVSWSGLMWLNVANHSDSTYMANYCPFDYCNVNKKIVDFMYDKDAQCLFNRAGILCGSCKENYSLAIGSSQCIHCPSNNNLALLIFFVTAGPLLVLFITILNLTVTQGMINGLILFANILWTYKSILLSQLLQSNAVLVFLKTFIAWLNLDFGIQTCFVTGLNAFWKTWAQYCFPVYIWTIVAAIVFFARRSTRLTNLFGGKAVSVLATLFLLSYSKLLQIIIVSVGFTEIYVFSTDGNHTRTVWSLDGNYGYCQFPHVLLFIVAILVFMFVWLPYTVVLFTIQWLRRKSNFALLKWVPKFNPIYDAHLAPLKDKHHYWFGVLLIVRGGLLVIFTSTRTIYPNVNFMVLIITAALLLCYSNYHRVYKNRIVQLSENFFLFLLVLVGATGILEDQNRYVIIYPSIGVGFLGLCGMILRGLYLMRCKRREVRMYLTPNKNRKISSKYAQFRDSILDETDPLFGDAQTVPNVAT